MNKILVIGKLDNQTKDMIEYFVKNNYLVTILAPEKNNPEFPLPESAELIIGNINDLDNLSTQTLATNQYIIYCIDQSSQQKRYSQEITKITELISLNPRSNTEKIIFDFTDPNLDLTNIWGTVNDVVMGGVSQSNFRLSNNRAIFSGIVSTENNGGFASVRTRNFAIPLNLSQYEGIELKVVGDGKRYKFITRCEGQWDGIGYCASFDTICNVPTVIRLQFCDLIPVFRAKTVSEVGAFDSSKIYAMQLMLSKFEYDGKLNPTFEPGVFGLEVEYIKAYGNKEKSQLIIVNPEQNSDDIEIILQKSNLNHNNYTIFHSHSLLEQLKNIF